MKENDCNMGYKYNFTTIFEEPKSFFPRISHHHPRSLSPRVFLPSKTITSTIRCQKMWLLKINQNSRT